MNKFFVNMTANFIGNIWMVIMNIAFIPLYIHLLGIEAFGLIGFYVSLQTIFSVFDIGLGTTLNREIARLIVLPDSTEEIRNSVRTLEILYWILGLFIGLGIYLLAPLIATYWFHSQQLSPVAQLDKP